MSWGCCARLLAPHFGISLSYSLVMPLCSNNQKREKKGDEMSITISGRAHGQDFSSQSSTSPTPYPHTCSYSGRRCLLTFHPYNNIPDDVGLQTSCSCHLPAGVSHSTLAGSFNCLIYNSLVSKFLTAGSPNQLVLIYTSPIKAFIITILLLIHTSLINEFHHSINCCLYFINDQIFATQSLLVLHQYSVSSLFE